MKYLLDTSTCIRYLNRRSENVIRRMEANSPDDVAVSSITKAELFYGAMKSQAIEQTLAHQQEFLRPLVSLPFDDTAAMIYGRIRAKLASEGKIIGPNDLLIAATALAHNLILVTNNTGEFSRVEGLRLESWE